MNGDCKVAGRHTYRYNTPIHCECITPFLSLTLSLSQHHQEIIRFMQNAHFTEIFPTTLSLALFVSRGLCISCTRNHQTDMCCAYHVTHAFECSYVTMTTPRCAALRGYINSEFCFQMSIQMKKKVEKPMTYDLKY